MKLTAQNALDLARTFRDAAKAVGDYLYGNWNTLPPAGRDRLRSMDVSLMNVATDLVTHAVGIILDEGQASLNELSGATQEATQAVKSITEIKKAIVIATALIGLAAAIPTGSMSTMVAALQNLKDATAFK